MNLIYRTLLISSIVIICLTSVDAQWTLTKGPYGGEIRSFCVSGGSIFAGTTDGIFRSLDNGAHWTPVNDGMTGKYISALSACGSAIFASTLYDGGIFRSIDNGDHWTLVSKGLSDVVVEGMAVSGTTIYAGLFNCHVYRSTDLGKTWVAVDGGLYSSDNYITLSSMAVRDSILLAGTTGGMSRSTNNGVSWTGTGVSEWIHSIAVDGKNIYAGGIYNVFRSKDNGATWKPSWLGIDAYAVAVKDTFIFAGTKYGVYRSSVNSDIWQPAESIVTDNEIRALAVVGNTILSGSDGGGVFLSTDNGNSWNASSNGLTGAYINSLAVSGANWYIATLFGGVFRMADNSDSWIAINNGLPRNKFNAITAQGNTVVAGTSFYYMGISHHIPTTLYRSANNGDVWTAADTTIFSNTIMPLHTELVNTSETKYFFC